MMRNRIFQILKKSAMIVLIAVAALVISWAVAVFVYWLLAWCFNWDFTLRYATGFWLIYGLITSLLAPLASRRKD